MSPSGLSSRRSSAGNPAANDPQQSRNTPCKYKSTLFAALIIAVTINTTQSSCQTNSNLDFKHHNRHQQQRDQLASRQQRQFMSKQATSPTTSPPSVGQAQQQYQQVRQANLPTADQLPGASSESGTTGHQQEEFSLAIGAAPGSNQQQANYTLVPQQQVVSSLERPSAAVGTGSREGSPESSSNTTPPIPSDTIGSPVALQPPATTTSSIPPSTGSSSSSPNLSSAKLASSDQAPAQVNITAGPAGGANGHTQEATAQQPSKELHPVHSNRQHQAAGRQMENLDDTIQRGGHFTGTPSASSTTDQFQMARHNQEDLFQQTRGSHYQQATTVGAANSRPGVELQQTHSFGINQGQPVSGSPSSISIITPLIGPPLQQQQQQQHTTTVSASIGTKEGGQQQSMMQPLFVLGNPISEHDYSAGGNTLFYHQYPKETTVASGGYPSQTAASDNSAREPIATGASKAAKGVDLMQHPVSAPLDPQDLQRQAPAATGQAKAPEPSEHQHLSSVHSSRADKTAEVGDLASTDRHELSSAANTSSLASASSSSNLFTSDRMSGPPLVYTGGHLSTASSAEPSMQASNANTSQQVLAPASPRLLQSGAAVLGNNPRRPSLPPPVSQANAASGFRSPLSPSGPLGTSQQSQISGTGANALLPPINNVQSPGNGLSGGGGGPNFYQSSPPYAGTGLLSGAGGSIFNSGTPPVLGYNKPAQNGYMLAQQANQLVTSINQPAPQIGQAVATGSATGAGSSAPITGGYSSRRPLNITRVEHISAECSNDLIRAVIVFNGTFKGIIYSSGYVNDPTCLYVNGTGSTRYEFSIRLNQCGTLGRQELHQPTIPGEARRRDQVMWNTLSIQYNSIIEQEWDEHFRVSCEYGSDFWKTVSFSPFNVETNTGSPVVFTINPPQCQMDVLLGHGMGPKIAVDGPVTVGDPLTLLIHMKSEKAGYDILVKNCVAHNGGKQRMQLIDSNGCVVNERFISPFRGTYNDNDLRHVTLYAYLKAFRFTGSPVLYLECEIHMCQSACPPQMCYWRRLSKRSVDDFDYEYTANNSLAHLDSSSANQQELAPVMSESLSLFKALQVRQESEPSRARRQMRDIYAEDEEASLICYRHKEVLIFVSIMALLLLLVITIALTCTMRLRRLTNSSQQYKHNRLQAGSLSPSLLSVDGALSGAGSLFGAGSLLSMGSNKATCPEWQHFRNASQPNRNYHPHSHPNQHQQHSPIMNANQPKPPLSMAIQNEQRARAFQAARCHQ